MLEYNSNFDFIEKNQSIEKLVFFISIDFDSQINLFSSPKNNFQTLLNGTTLASQLNGHMIQDNEQQSPTANKKMISNGIIQLKSTTSSPSTDQPITSLNNIELETNKDMNDLNTTSTTISATNTEQSKSLTDKEDRKVLYFWTFNPSTCLFLFCLFVIDIYR